MPLTTLKENWEGPKGGLWLHSVGEHHDIWEALNEKARLELRARHAKLQAKHDAAALPVKLQAKNGAAANPAPTKAKKTAKKLPPVVMKKAMKKGSK